MQLITVTLLLLVANSLAADVCKPTQYGSFLTCLNTAINGDWAKIKADSTKYIQGQESLYEQCYKTNGCSTKLDFKDFTDGLDESLKKPADHIRQLWNGAPRAFHNCVLTDARDRFFNLLQTCVQEKISNFQFPETKDLPEVPLPPVDMYADKDMKENLIKFVNDKLVAVIGTKTCEKNKKELIDCIKSDLKSKGSACVNSNLCGSDCKSSYKPTCEVVSKCIPEILEGKRGEITTLLDKSRSVATRFLGKCEELGKVEEPKYRYPRKLILQLFESIQPLLEDEGKAAKFTSLFKDTVEAYFDVNALCGSGGCQ